MSFHVARVRSGGASQSRHGAELERSLKALLKEADLASSSLHDQLLRRQQSLEKLLREIEGAESRVNRAVMSAESRVEESAPASRRAAAETAPAAPRTPSVDREGWGPEAPSFGAVSRPPRAAQGRAAARAQTNIYGEPITDAAPPRPAASAPAPRAAQTAVHAPSPLAASIEREVIPTAPARPVQPKVTADSADAIAEVRRAAEDLLRAGRDLEFVSNRTKLPLEEVRLLSQLVLQDVEHRAKRESTPPPAAPLASAVAVEREESASAADPRLGVLSPIRRSIETI